MASNVVARIICPALALGKLLEYMVEVTAGNCEVLSSHELTAGITAVNTDGTAGTNGREVDADPRLSLVPVFNAHGFSA
jgi:hypothetical protein